MKHDRNVKNQTKEVKTNERKIKLMVIKLNENETMHTNEIYESVEKETRRFEGKEHERNITKKKT